MSPGLAEECALVSAILVVIIIIIIIIIYPLYLFCSEGGFKNWWKWLKGYDAQSVQSGTGRLSCCRTALKRCTTAMVQTWWRPTMPAYLRVAANILLPPLPHGRLQWHMTQPEGRILWHPSTTTCRFATKRVWDHLVSRPSGLFPSDWNSPMGSLVTGTPAEAKLRAIKSLRAWCLSDLPGALLSLKSKCRLHNGIISWLVQIYADMDCRMNCEHALQIARDESLRREIEREREDWDEICRCRCDGLLRNSEYVRIRIRSFELCRVEQTHRRI